MKIRELNPRLAFCGTALQLAVSFDEGQISQGDLSPELPLLILVVPPSP